MPRGGFRHCVPFTPGKKIHLNTFCPHLRNADKSVVLAPDVLTHFTSSPEPTGMVLRTRGLLMSHIQGGFYPTLVTRTRGQCGIASASFKGCTPEVRAHLLIPGHYSRSPAVPLRSTKQQLPLSHGPQGRCWLKRCLGPREANSALTLPTALRARRVAQANLEARARQVTIPIAAITAAWVFIGGYTPSATATEQIRETKSENVPSTAEQIKALLPFLITFPFC